ncbi:MAG: DUF4340 domain-containing protein [Planctomycetes bacterium]|nr:DUF4340 domain-containing protein [Planctomycetota bacterium]
MNETTKTLSFAAVAGLLALAAVVTVPRYRPPEVFNDLGQAFYPEFKDPLRAAALKVVEYDEATATAKEFKVELRNGRWVIPSHHNYPADAKERMAKTAAGVIDLIKDTVRSDRPQDHEQFGVIDPLDDKVTTMKGRGKRITFRDAEGRVLADFIFGNEGREGVTFVRVPGQKRVYGLTAKPEISAKFEDWIETDLLKLSASSLRRIRIDNYSVDEVEGRIKNRHEILLTRDDSSGPWKVGEMTDQEEVNTENITSMTGALDDLKIVGVRAKPPGLTRELKQGDQRQLNQQDVISLRQRGFYLVRGELQSNEGETEVVCDDGVIYLLRFGEVVIGAGEELTAGTSADKKDEKKEGTEGRYLFVTTRFDESILPPAPGAPPEFAADPAWTDEEKKQKEEEHQKRKEEVERQKKEREDKVAAGQKRAQELTNRFADWYYVISAENFKNLRRSRAELVKPKEQPK